MQAINLRSFKRKVKLTARSMKRFLTKLEKAPPRGLDKMTVALEPEVWKEVDCLTCANCCKTMTPTYTKQDIKRISAHFNQTPKEFMDKWLIYEKKDKDWQNKKQPCQFLNLTDNKCSIYEIRPLDCSGFPHLPRKKMIDYMHVHKQNIEYCPATYKLVEKMQAAMNL
jgi:Fe-S-cluster containining protein